MKVYCPKCNTCYSIEAGLLPADGRKLRCSRCQEVWMCYHSNLKDDDDVIEQNNNTAPQTLSANEAETIITNAEKDKDAPLELSEEDAELPIPENEMNLIFSRLKSEHSKIDSEIKKLPPLKQNLPKIKKLLGWNSYFTISVEIFTILLICLLSLFAYRYELVRKIPQAKFIFDQFNIPCVIVGEGLEFQNIVRSFDSPKEPRLLSIKGYIYNSTAKELQIPKILINIMDKDAESILQTTKELNEKSLHTHSTLAFTLKEKIPLTAKYIEITFTE